jgi:hypothetical protein
VTADAGAWIEPGLGSSILTLVVDRDAQEGDYLLERAVTRRLSVTAKTHLHVDRESVAGEFEGGVKRALIERDVAGGRLLMSGQLAAVTAFSSSERGCNAYGGDFRALAGWSVDGRFVNIESGWRPMGEGCGSHRSELTAGISHGRWIGFGQWFVHAPVNRDRHANVTHKVQVSAVGFRNREQTGLGLQVGIRAELSDGGIGSPAVVVALWSRKG